MPKILPIIQRCIWDRTKHVLRNFFAKIVDFKRYLYSQSSSTIDAKQGPKYTIELDFFYANYKLYRIINKWLLLQCSPTVQINHLCMGRSKSNHLDWFRNLPYNSLTIIFIFAKMLWSRKILEYGFFPHNKMS